LSAPTAAVTVAAPPGGDEPYARTAPRADRPGDRDRTRELRYRPGWAWGRVVRTREDYERMLDGLAGEHDPARGREPVARRREALPDREPAAR
jgi:hypothetical protein